MSKITVKAKMSLEEESLRDYFAAQALVGLLAITYGGDLTSVPAHSRFAETAYQLADAMLEARK